MNLLPILGYRLLGPSTGSRSAQRQALETLDAAIGGIWVFEKASHGCLTFDMSGGRKGREAAFGTSARWRG